MQAKWDRYMAHINAVYTAKNPESLTEWDWIYAFYAESDIWKRARAFGTQEFRDEIEQYRAAEAAARGEGGVAKGRGIY